MRVLMLLAVVMYFVVLLNVDLAVATSKNINDHVQFMGKQISIGTSEADFNILYPLYKPFEQKMPTGVKGYNGPENSSSALFLRGKLACVVIKRDEESSELIPEYQMQLIHGIHGFNKIKSTVTPDKDQPNYEEFRYDYVRGTLVATDSGIATISRTLIETTAVCNKKNVYELKKILPKNTREMMGIY